MRCVVLMVAGSTLLSGCGGAANEKASERPGVRDSAGVRIYENGPDNRAAPWGFERVADLIAPDSALSAFPWSIAADPSTGRIYVGDRTTPRVLVFDASGSYVARLGGSGEGPGEFRRPTALSVGPDGVLMVWDTARGILSRWSAAGDLLEERPAPVDHWGPGVWQGPESLVTVTSETDGLVMKQTLVRLRGDDREVLHVVPREQQLVELPCMRAPMPRLMSASVVWAAHGEAVYVLRGPEYRIDRVEAGQPVTSIRRAVPPREVTASDAVERAGAEFGPFLQRCGVTPARIVDLVGYESPVSAVQWLAVSPDGTLWVARGQTGIRPEAVDAISADGGYVGTVSSHVLPVAFVSVDRFVGLRVLEGTREVSLSVYRLEDAATDEPDRLPGTLMDESERVE